MTHIQICFFNATLQNTVEHQYEREVIHLIPVKNKEGLVLIHLPFKVRLTYVIGKANLMNHRI